MKDFSIHILSLEASNIYINGNFLGLIDNLETFSIDLKVYSNSLIITKEPISNNKKLMLPYTVKLEFTNNSIVCDSEFVTIVPYKNNEYEVVLNICEIKSNKPLNKVYDNYVGNYNVVVVNDGISYINIYEQNSLKWSANVPEINAVVCEMQNNKLIIKGATLNGKHYLIVLDEQFNELQNCEVEKIEQNEFQIKSLKKINDIAKHAIVKTINLNNLEQSEEYYVYLKDNAVIANHKKLVPYAFLEAIKIKNFNLAKEYLTPELSRKTQAEHLQNYFNNLSKIYYNSYLQNEYVINYTVLCDNYKSYDFTIINNQIDDIEEITL